ncbi:MAG: FkbM family methyltransferase [Amylibacter sp.]|nr:FkbM family methyltransferase [Amylibacter sp.]
MYIVRHLRRRLKTLKGMTIVHVGAHQGQEAAEYDTWGAAKVIWIEADPAQLPGLEKTIKQVEALPRSLFARIFGAPKTKHQVINALVGDVDGADTDFYLFANAGASNSLFTKLPEVDERYEWVKETGEVLHLKMRTLDTLLTENGISADSIDFLAMDIQGAELMCLKGAAKVLQNLHYIETEISKTPFYDGGVLLDELEPWLNARGFHCKTWLRRNFMNAVFVR